MKAKCMLVSLAMCHVKLSYCLIQNVYFTNVPEKNVKCSIINVWGEKGSATTCLVHALTKGKVCQLKSTRLVRCVFWSGSDTKKKKKTWRIEKIQNGSTLTTLIKTLTTPDESHKRFRTKEGSKPKQPSVPGRATPKPYKPKLRRKEKPKTKDSGQQPAGDGQEGRSKILFAFSYTNIKVYYIRLRSSTVSEKKGRVKRVRDIEFCPFDHQLKWVTSSHVDTSSLKGRRGFGPKSYLKKGKLVSVKYDQMNGLTFLLTRTHIIRFTRISEKGGKSIASVKRPYLMELAYLKKQVFWIEGSPVNSHLKIVSYNGGPVKLINSRLRMTGFYVHPEGKYIYFCGPKTMIYIVDGAKLESTGFPICIDIESDENSFFVLTKKGTILEIVSRKSVFEWQLPRRYLFKGGLRIGMY